ERAHDLEMPIILRRHLQRLSRYLGGELGFARRDDSNNAARLVGLDRIVSIQFVDEVGLFRTMMGGGHPSNRSVLVHDGDRAPTREIRGDQLREFSERFLVVEGGT